MASATQHPPLRRRATLSGLEKLQVSVVVIVNHGDRHLDRVLAAVGFCDELLVLPAGAMDGVSEICATHHARVEHQPATASGSPRQQAIALAKHDWVLVIADDEILDYEAATTIQVLDYTDPARAWSIRRRTYVGAREIRFGTWAWDQPVRLFNRTRVSYDDQVIDEAVAVPPEVNQLQLQGSLHHYRFVDHADLFASVVHQARTRVAAPDQHWSRLGLLSAMMRAAWAFLHSFVVRRGFRDGISGLLVAMAVAVEEILAPVLAQERSEPPAG